MSTNNFPPFFVLHSTFRIDAINWRTRQLWHHRQLKRRTVSTAHKKKRIPTLYNYEWMHPRFGNNFRVTRAPRNVTNALQKSLLTSSVSARTFIAISSCWTISHRAVSHNIRVCIRWRMLDFSLYISKEHATRTRTKKEAFEAQLIAAVSHTTRVFLKAYLHGLDMHLMAAKSMCIQMPKHISLSTVRCTIRGFHTPLSWRDIGT